jgi:hypothetical protein
MRQEPDIPTPACAAVYCHKTILSVVINDMSIIATANL